MTEGIRKFVTRKYPYLIYYTLDESTDELIILSIRHPAQAREHDGAQAGRPYYFLALSTCSVALHEISSV